MNFSVDLLNYVVLSVITLLCFYPFYYVLIYSFSNPDEAARGISLWPAGFTLVNYETIFKLNNIMHSALISVARTVIGTMITIICSSFFAYLVTQPKMRFRKTIYRFAILTIYFNAGMIPYYLTMKELGLKDSFLLYVIPSAIVPFFVILMKTYIESIPPTLAESAKIDGAGYIRTFVSIIFPVSKPIIATIAVFSAVAQWGTFYDNLLLVSDTKLQTLQLVLYNYLTTSQNIVNMADMTNGNAAKAVTPQSVQVTITMITTIPIIIVYPWLQKYFTKGIMLGAVKG